MSGICGWNNNQLDSENAASVLQTMTAKQHFNTRHTIDNAVNLSCALATVGNPADGGIASKNGLNIAVQGNIRWLDNHLEATAKAKGTANAILEAYNQQGINFLKIISGAFAISIIDEANAKTLLIIDRLGIGTLSYALEKNQLIFASSARALRTFPGVNKGINPQAIYDYLYFHMVPSPRSIFNGIEKLLPGQYLVYENNTISKSFYWQPEYKENNPSGLAKLEEEFLAILESSVGRAAQTGNVGAFLSGGTDSSTVSGMFRKIKETPVDTFSIGFNATGYDETEYARLAAKHFDTRPHEYYLTPQDVVDAIPLIAQAYDEPFGNASAVAAYYCAKMARKDGIEALLAGDGGDELFAGNERYGKQKVFGYYHQVSKPIRQYLIEPLLFNLPLADKIKPLAKVKSYINQANVPMPERLETYNFLNRTPLQEVFEAEFLTKINTKEPSDYLRETYQRAKADSALNNMLYLDLKFTLADNDLRKVNRMCELAQIEVRYPLLDEDLVRFSAELPSTLKLKGLKLRYFFKHALRNFLPDEIINKSKHGFGLPFGLWINEYMPLKELAHESLNRLSQRGIVKRSYIEELIGLHQEFPSYYGMMIWVMMMLEQWLRAEEAEQ